jgi:uncharacterized protein YggU (UPF0235/DUF167 family)
MNRTARLLVRLTPRAGQDRIEGWAIDSAGRPYLKARTAAPPVDGKANQALERMIARALGVPASSVSLAAGAASRIKTLEITGADEVELRRRLGSPS